jgi:hypothetical protein
MPKVDLDGTQPDKGGYMCGHDRNRSLKALRGVK